jgi:molecular chaperone GrpE (heat shock protein)
MCSLRVSCALAIALMLAIPSIESFMHCCPTIDRSTRSNAISRLRPTSKMVIDDDQSSTFVNEFLEVDVKDGLETVEEVVEEKPVVVLSPYQEAVMKYKAQVEKELEYIESVLKCERNLLMLRKDTISVSGKNGYFFVQAEVAEFQKKKEIEQKNRVLRNKREFVQRMLPVVDSFRAAPTLAPSSNEREESMHKNFGSLSKSLMDVFEKYGYKEFNAGGSTNYVLLTSGT